MQRRIRFRLATAAVLLVASTAAPAVAQQSAKPRVTIEYRETEIPAHVAIRQALIDKRAFEAAQVLFEAFRLPKPLALIASDCGGEVNAWFDGDAITICYEYLAYVFESARSPHRPAWVSERDAVAGATADVILHEGAHALFDYLDVPILGREEDAADQVAAYLLLSVGREEAPRLVAGIVYVYLNEAGVRDIPALKRRRLGFVNHQAFADAHSTPIQRMYNTLCLAYGAAPDLFGEAVRHGALPLERAEGCADEFAQADKAFRRLLLPHAEPQALERFGVGGGLGARRP